MRAKPCLFFTMVSLLVAGTAPAVAQSSASDIVMRLEALESQIRQLTGQVEQLQYRNQQLEQQLRGAGAGDPARMAQPQRPPVQQAQPPMLPPVQPTQQPDRRADIDQPRDPRFPDQRTADPRFSDPRLAPRDNPNFVATPNPGGRRGDAFDPNANPSAPGAPRALGALPPGQPSAPPRDPNDDDGVRSGRDPGAPMDLANMANDPSARRGGALPPPPQRPVSGTGALAAVQPPGASPRDQFDLGVGYIKQRDYASAEQAFRDFIERFPSDRLAPDANYWLGETLYLRRRYQDAAEAYLVVTTKYESAGRAPDSLLRLGQSLAAMRQKEMACASFAEVGRKYPKASTTVKTTVEREQQRVGC